MRLVARLTRLFGGSRWELLFGLGRGPGEDFGVDFREGVCNEDLSLLGNDEEAGVAEGLGDGLTTLFVGTVTVIFFRVVFGFALPNMAVLMFVNRSGP